jgi:hypothetical protein
VVAAPTVASAAVEIKEFIRLQRLGKRPVLAVKGGFLGRWM